MNKLIGALGDTITKAATGRNEEGLKGKISASEEEIWQNRLESIEFLGKWFQAQCESVCDQSSYVHSLPQCLCTLGKESHGGAEGAVSSEAQAVVLWDHLLMVWDARKVSLIAIFCFCFVLARKNKKSKHVNIIDFLLKNSDRQLSSGPQDHKNLVSSLSQNSHIKALFLQIPMTLLPRCQKRN